jgi:hypothetical protein
MQRALSTGLVRRNVTIKLKDLMPVPQEIKIVNEFKESK